MKKQSQLNFMLPAILAIAGWSAAAPRLEVVHEWKYIDYVWKDSQAKTAASLSGKYDYTRIIPTDFQKITGNRVLVATPRYYNNPASLSIISKKFGDGGPLLQPYPSWKWHERRDCTGIISVSRIFLDKCDRLWIVDSGKIGNRQICPAQILAFDPKTDGLLRRVRVPRDLSHNSVNVTKGRLEVQFVETKGCSCSKTWVYVGDPEGNGLVIWDGLSIWRLENDDVFSPEPAATTYTIAGENVTLEIGTSTLAIPPPGFLDEDYLLLRSMSSLSDYAVKVKDLHDSKKRGSTVTYYKGNITLPTQELVRVISDSGILVGALASSLVVACWYIGNPLALEYIDQPLEDDAALQFTTAGQIVRGDGSGFEHEEYWLMSNRLQKFVSDNMDFDSVNYRILRLNIADLVRGTVCEPTGSPSASTIEEKFFFRYESSHRVII